MLQRYLAGSAYLGVGIMAKFMNLVWTTVKADCRDEFLKQHSEGLEFDGLASFSLIQTGDYSYCSVGIWDSEDHLINARPLMIEFLNSIRHMMEEISPELGITDPVSGPVVFER